MPRYPDHVYNDPLYQRALGFMHAAHLSVENAPKDHKKYGQYGQKRKYSLEAYSVHPRAVAAMIAALFPDDMNLIVAALLHDTVEDVVWVTPLILIDQFNADVAELVHHVTDYPIPGSNRAERDAAHIDKLIAGIPPRAQSLKLADTSHNLPNILREDPGFGHLYAKQKVKAMPYLQHGHPALVANVQKILDDHFADYNAHKAAAGQ